MPTYEEEVERGRMRIEGARNVCEHLLDGLVKAGLMPDHDVAPTDAPPLSERASPLERVQRVLYGLAGAYQELAAIHTSPIFVAIDENEGAVYFVGLDRATAIAALPSFGGYVDTWVDGTHTDRTTIDPPPPIPCEHPDKGWRLIPRHALVPDTIECTACCATRPWNSNVWTPPDKAAQLTALMSDAKKLDEVYGSARFGANAKAVASDAAVDMILFCPNCGFQHVDAPDPATHWTNPPHKSHLCHECAHVWRPADVTTNGVAEIHTNGSGDSPNVVRARAKSAPTRRIATGDRVGLGSAVGTVVGTMTVDLSNGVAKCWVTWDGATSFATEHETATLKLF